MRVCLKIELLVPSTRASFTSNTRRGLVARRYFKILTPSEKKRQRRRERERERERRREKEPLFRKETTAQKDPWNFHVEERNVRQKIGGNIVKESLISNGALSNVYLPFIHAIYCRKIKLLRRENSKRHFSLFKNMCIEIPIQMLANVFLKAHIFHFVSNPRQSENF